MPSDKHDKLTRLAMRWLRNSAAIADYRDKPASVRCGVVLGNLTTSCWEVPDAMGWFGGGRFTILIEVKVTYADFKKDATKSFRRRPATGMGNYRYYLAEPALIAKAELPEHWGLLEVVRRSVRVEQLATRQESLRVHETQLLWSALRRRQAALSRLELESGVMF